MTRWDRLRAKLAGKAADIVPEPAPRTAVADWQKNMTDLHKRLYTGWKAPHITLMRSGKFDDGSPKSS